MKIINLLFNYNIISFKWLKFALRIIYHCLEGLHSF